MTKIARFTGNLTAFASTATGTERTVFGDTAQSDTIDDNVNSDFLLGWEIVTANDAPALQDFNGLGFTLSQVLAYIHQMGIVEWRTLQEYYLGSAVVHDGKVYVSQTTPNTGNDPSSSPDKWKDISGGRTIVATADATPTAISTIAVPENSCITIEAKINGIIDDYSAAVGGTITYTVRRVGAGAVEVGVPSIVSVHDSGTGVPAIDADVSGNNIRLLVTGVLAEDWNWVASYSYNFTV